MDRKEVKFLKFKIGSLNFEFWRDKPINKKKGGRPRIKVPVDEIVKLYDEGKSVRQLAEIYHVSKSTISNIVRNPQKYQ